MLRNVVYWVCHRCLRWFYREHRVVGLGKVPASGPVILVGNHPNDLSDVIAGLYVTPRPVRYIATVSVTTSWAARTMYQAMGVIPVARVRDARKMRAEGVDLAAVNQAANDTVAAALAQGDAITVFPEGGVHDVPEIGRLRTGVAKMVLTHLDAGANNDVTIVPFGAQYEAPRTWGSDMLSVVGTPWSARAWVEAQPEGQRGPSAFTDALKASLLTVTRNAPTWEEAATRDEIVAAVAAQLAPRDPLGATTTVLERAAQLAADAHSDGPSGEAVRIKTAAHTLARAVERAGGIGTSSVDHARLLFALDVQKGPAPVPTIALWMGVPAAGMGWLVHAPILALVYWVAKRGATARTDVVPRCFAPGLYLVLGWWLLTALLLAVGLGLAGWSPLWALPALVTLPRFGDLAIGWRTWLMGWQLVQRVQKWSTPDRMALREAAATVRELWEAAAGGW
jgi:1-acyl-sn-glycerol-3-phosphate acyltransferase